MKALIPVALMIAAVAFGSLEFSQDAGGSILQWSPVEGGWQYLVVKCSEEEYDAEDPDWGVELATIYPDEDGVFPESVQIPAAFVVDPNKCIGCGICVNQCPTQAISIDTEGMAVIDPELCIACGICSNACPTGAIFAPSSNMKYGLFGVDEEGTEEFIEGSAQ